MTDERLDAVFAGLEVRLTPPPAFADQLFERLAVDAGLRGRPARGFLDRVLWHRERGTPALGLAWAAILALLLAAAVAGVLLLGVGSRQGRLAVASPAISSPTTSAASGAPEETLSVHTPSTVLKPGVPAPNWRGRLLDGRAFSTDSLRGRPAAVLIWCQCLAHDPAPAFLDAARQREDVALVLVSMDLEGTTRGLVDSLGATTPVALDGQGDLMTAWGIQGFPALVLLRPDGTAADIQPATFDAAALASMLDSLAGGRAIPTARIPRPYPTDALGRQVLSSVLKVGEAAPELSGPGVDGHDHSTHDLLGSKAVVLFWLPPRADGSPQDDVPPPDRVIQAATAAGLRVLLVAEGEPAPGDARRYLDRLESPVPAIYDWTGELSERWGLLMGESMVLLDEQGRVGGYYGPQARSDPGPIVDAFGSGAPLPSPSLSAGH